MFYITLPAGWVILQGVHALLRSAYTRPTQYCLTCLGRLQLCEAAAA